MLEQITISPADALDLMAQAVEAKGADYIYPTGKCSYVSDGQPDCLVGCALSLAGVTNDELEAMDSQAFGSISWVELPERVTLLPGTREVFFEAQREQDSQRMWGSALESAQREAAALGLGVTLTA